MKRSPSNKDIFLTMFMLSLAVAVLFWVFGTRNDLAKQPQWAQLLKAEGIDNFYKVSDTLYRGAQPTNAGIATLKEMGIKTIINLRSFHSDRDEIGNTQIGYEHITMKAWHPERKEVVRFLKIVTNKDKTPVFIHCQYASDRTGLMCAIYRIIIEGWTKEEAIKEMTQGGFGFHAVWQNLIDFIKQLDVEDIRKAAGIEATVAN